MSVPIITLPVVAIGLVVVGILAVIGIAHELMKSSGIRCAVRDRLTAIVRACRDAGRRGKADGDAETKKKGRRRGSSGMIDGFPVRAMTAFLVAAFALFAAFFILTAYRQSGPLTFEAGLQEPGSEATTTTASPAVGKAMLVRATLKPAQEHLANLAVVVSGPSTIAFSWCNAYVSGEKIDGIARGPKGRIGLGDLGPDVQVTILCRFFVVRRIRSLEAVKVELTGADAGGKAEELYLAPPENKRGQEAAEAHADAEIRESPALWQRSSMVAREAAFGEQGKLWPLLDPHRLHGLDSMPAGRPTTLRHLEDTRVEPSRIVSLPATITSRPVTMEEFAAAGRHRRAVRQVFAIGEKPGERGAWCTTTTSTAQPRLHQGDRVELRAVVAEWGRSEASDGAAVMLYCPALRVLGSIGVAVRSSEAGATTVPDRFNRDGGR